MSTDFPQLSWINKLYNIMPFFFLFDAKFSIKICVFGHIRMIYVFLVILHVRRVWAKVEQGCM